MIKFGRKCEILKAKFKKEAEIWGYEFTFESWFVACLGWDDRTKELARAKGIVPIDPTTLKNMLKESNLYDPNITICPNKRS